MGLSGGSIMSEVRDNAGALKRRETQISRALSRLLRHRAVEEGLAIDADGFVAVEDVLRHHDLRCKHATLEDVIRVVATNDKQRFTLRRRDGDDDGSGGGGAYEICAVQGHSIASVRSTPEMRRLDAAVDADWPRYIVHGTYRSKLPLIKAAGGLSRMGRNHVHFSYTVPEKFRRYLREDTTTATTATTGSVPVISGLRASCQVLLLLDVRRVRNSGLEFYRSANGVILSPGDARGLVGIEYIERIVDCEHGILDWEDVGRE